MTAVDSHLRRTWSAGRRPASWATSALCLLAWLVFPSVVTAAPAAQLTPSAARGLLGNDVQLTLTATFTGTEYGGFPPPLSGLTFRLPFAVGSSAGFATCDRSTLEPSGRGPNSCPRASRAGPTGSTKVYVAFGNVVVPETATTEAFYGPEGQIFVFMFGHEPVLFENIATGTLQADTALYATSLRFAVPLVETVPGAQLVSTQAITVNVGTPTEGKPANGLFLLPGACPGATLPMSAEASFNGGAVSLATSSVACLAAAAPPPVLGRREGAAVTAGTVLVRMPGSSAYIPLSGAAGIPDGSELDTTAGTVTVTAATPAGAEQSAEAHGGVFRVHQVAAGPGDTDLALTAPLSGCGARGRAGTAARRHMRHLWVSDHGGRWSTKGRYVSTSVEGTSWLTADTCGSSTVRVKTGRVAVRDLLNQKRILLTAGRSVTVGPGRVSRVRHP
jgi:hypothetical protein